MSRLRVSVLLALLSLGAWGLRNHLPRFNSPAPAVNAPGLTSHNLAITDDGATLLVVNPDSNSVSFVDTASLTVQDEVPVGIDPRSIALYGHHAFVANQGSDSVSIIDLVSGSAVTTVGVGDRPVATAVTPDGRFLAVAELGADTIRFLDTATLTTVGRRPVADRPAGLSFTPDGRYLLVAHLLSGQVTRLAVLPYTLHLPAIIRRPPQDPELESDPVPAGGAAGRIAVGMAIATWPNVAPAPAIVVNRAGSRAYLPQTMANAQGFNTQFDATVFPKVSVLNLESWSHQTGEHISLPETDQPVGLPWDLILTRDDTELWVVNAASNDVSVIDISNPAFPLRRSHLQVGRNPRGIVAAPDGATLYVNNTLSGSVSVIDAQTYTVTAEIQVTDIPLPPLLLNGKRLFFSSARSDLARAAWIGCATCHVEGEHDGRTWQLQFTGELPPGAAPVITRNTTSLLGMVETYPLRWSAEWDESADSEFSIRFEQFGSGLIPGEMHPTLGPPNQGRSPDLDALAAYIDSLPVPERTHALSPAAQRGEAIFASSSTGCLRCHPPPLYTDLQRHDVGTADADGEWFGPAIDTPTLRFLYDSAPYLHDGSAATLADVLTSGNEGDRHGITSHLNARQQADLIAFLLSLPL